MRWRPNVSSSAPRRRVRAPGSSTDALDTISQVFQFCLDPVAMVSLHLDGAVADRSPGAAELLESLRQFQQQCVIIWQIGHHRHRLPTPSFAVAQEAHEAVVGILPRWGAGAGRAAHTVLLGAPAASADSHPAHAGAIDDWPLL